MKIIDERPQVFQKTESSIWTDPYIQGNLLNSYLDLASDAASRNIDSINITVNFINEHIGENNRLLDLGCGPGLYAELLAQRGHTITGVDFNKKAIDYAKAHSTEIKYLETDYINNFPKSNYDAIIIIYCDMGTHSDSDRDVLLKNCYDSLEKGGKLIFDVFSAKLVEERSECNNWEYSKGGGFWSDNEYLLLSQTFHYPENNTFAYQYNLVQADNVKHFIIWERYYTEEDIIEVLRKIGFSKITLEKELLGRNNFTSNNELFIIAQK